MTSVIYSGFLYLISIFMFLFSLKPIIFWILMEINLLVFLYLSYSYDLGKKLYQEESIFIYFAIQSLSSFIFLSSIYFQEDHKILSDLFFISSLSMKLGIFPFYFWVLSVSENLKYQVFVILMSIQKIPIFLIFFNISPYLVMTILLFSFFFGSIMIFFSTKVLELLIFSSISSSFWVFLIYLNGMDMFILFFSLYFFSLALISSKNGSISDDKFSNVVLFMFLCGIPPFSIFFFKFYLCFTFLASSMFMMSLFWSLSVVSLIGYTKFFYGFFFNGNFFYLNYKFFQKKMFFLLIAFLNLFLFGF